MTQLELLDQVETWVIGHGLEPAMERESASVRFHFEGNAGEWLCTVICEQTPLLLQVMCRLPVLVPSGKVSAVALALHRLNSTIRVGSFSLAPEDGKVTFRLPMPIYVEAPVDEQIETAIATAGGTLDNHMSLLCLCLFDQPEVRDRLEVLLPLSPLEKELRACPHRGRAERN